MLDPRPVMLVGKRARLEPLGIRHAAGLLAVGRDERVFRFMLRGPLTDEEDAHAYISRFLDGQEKGAVIPFASIDAVTERVAGLTTYLNISVRDSGLEIGNTWLGVEYQRTAINTECKYLLLRHAFETLGCARVQLKTDLLNERSQRAIERIGASREGVLRKYQLTQGGRIRDTVIYSIIDAEWPVVKSRLEGMLQR